MWRLIPVILSCLILAAHFSRANLLAFTILSIIVAFLPFYRSGWVPRFMQWFLILGTFEWLRTIFFFVNERIDLEQPWMRLVIILGSVALFTLLSAFTFQNKTLKEKYTSNKK